MHTILSELGYEPYIVTTNHKNVNISFISKTTNIIVIDNYSEIKENDFDILLVNSDQTWRKWDKYFYDYGFLKFAEKWNKLKFVYGASLGFDYWRFNEKDEEIMRPLIKNFSDISVREQGSIKLINKHFGISPKLVLDPTLIIDKKHYLNLIKNYNSNINDTIDYLFVYFVYNLPKEIKYFLEQVKKELNYHIYYFKLNNNSLVEDFIFHIKHSKAVVTNSFHCTVFSILFEKPFLSFNYNFTGIERIKSLSELLGFTKRIIYINQKPKIQFLINPPEIDKKKLYNKQKESLNYLKNNLNLYRRK